MRFGIVRLGRVRSGKDFVVVYGTPRCGKARFGKVRNLRHGEAGKGAAGLGMDSKAI